MTEKSGQVLLTVRPRKIAILAAIGAAAVVAVMVVVALQLKSGDTGVYFRTADVISLIAVGLLFAAGMMLVARPRLRVTSEGVRVRNVLGEKEIEWALIHRIVFPEGAQWAQLELADDEMASVMAIQAMDKGRAVEALQQFRRLHAQYGPPAPVISAEARARALPKEDPNRPLGRLEKIDRERASQGVDGKRKRPGPK